MEYYAMRWVIENTRKKEKIWPERVRLCPGRSPWHNVRLQLFERTEPNFSTVANPAHHGMSTRTSNADYLMILVI